jgi:uncharacterized membrane protein
LHAAEADRGGLLVRVVGSVEIDRPVSQVWVYVADYGNDTGWRAAVRQMPLAARTGSGWRHYRRAAAAGGHDLPYDATIERVAGRRLLQWRAHDR